MIHPAFAPAYVTLSECYRMLTVLEMMPPGEVIPKVRAACTRALTLDPASVSAQRLLASALAGRAIDNMTEAAALDIGRADELSQQALAAAARSPYAHARIKNINI